jgi:signal transduction histidine kinase
LAGSYLAVFLAVIAALSILAYTLIAWNYRDLLGPAVATPEAQLGVRNALRTVALSILTLDAALSFLVAAASYLLARAAVYPLVLARQREERFAGDVAHELRTPLSVIVGAAQTALHPETSREHVEKALKSIVAQALEAGNLIGDLLTLARKEGACALMREPLDLAALVTRVVHERRSQELPHEVAFVLQARSVIIVGEEARLRQLVRNLLDNAVRYAGSTVWVNVGEDGRYALLSVEDDGPGVEPAVRASLFERFAKGSKSYGSGLGLAICRWVAQAHGGSITHESGSRFVTRIPRA